MKSLKSESCSSLTISTALGYMAWSKTKLVVVRFVVFHSLHLSWGAFYARQISSDIFFSGCFWSFTQKPLPCLDDLFFTAFLMPQYTPNNVFMLWYQVVQLIKIILQELNWQWVWSMFTFDVWLKLLWDRFKWATLLKVQKCWYYPMKFMFTLLEGLFHWFRIKWHCIWTQNYDHNCHKRMWRTCQVGCCLAHIYAHFHYLTALLSAFFSVALISSCEILCPKRFSQRMVLTESVFRFIVRRSWTCFGTHFLFFIFFFFFNFFSKFSLHYTYTLSYKYNYVKLQFKVTSFSMLSKSKIRGRTRRKLFGFIIKPLIVTTILIRTRSERSFT